MILETPDFLALAPDERLVAARAQLRDLEANYGPYPHGMPDAAVNFYDDAVEAIQSALDAL